MDAKNHFNYLSFSLCIPISYFLLFFLSLSPTFGLASLENDPRDHRNNTPGLNGGNSSHTGPQYNFTTTTLQNFNAGTMYTPNGHFEAGLDQSPLLLNKKKLRFNPYLNISPNTGGLRTQFSIPAPANLANFNSLIFSYDSFSQTDMGYGIGWTLSLPRITRNNRGGLFPQFYVQQLGDSELVKIYSHHVSEEKRNYLLQLARPLVGQSANIQIDLYRPLFERDFHHFYRLGEMGWLVLALDGQSYLFNERGQLVYQLGAYSAGKIGVSFIWQHGQLIQVREGLGNEEVSLWSIDLKYDNEGMKSLPQEFQGEFAIFQRLKSITSSHSESGEKNYFNFSYSGDFYLTRALQKFAFRPLFLGRYESLVKVEEQEEKNDVNESRQYYFYNSASGVQTDQVNEEEDVHYLYVDLNNDGLDDKIQIDLREKSGHLRNLYKHQLFQKDKIGQDHYPFVTNTGPFHIRIDMQGQYRDGFVGLLYELNNIRKTKYSFYVAESKQEQDGNSEFTTSYRSMDNLFEDYDLLPEYVTYDKMWQVWKEHKDRGYTFSYEVPEYEATTASLKFVDLNNDLRKDLIVCPTVKELDKKTISYKDNNKHSNFILSVVSLMNGSVEKDRFTSVFGDESGGAPKIHYQVGSNQSNGEKDLENFKTTLTSFDLTEFRRQDSFTCHQYSLFQDFNQDGIIDVLTGRHLYLRSSLGHFFHKVLSDQELKNFFEAKSFEQFRVDSGDYLILDLNQDGKLELQKARALVYDQKRGEQVLFKNGSTLKTANMNGHKALSKMDSLSGGDISFEYEMTLGVWTLIKYIKDAGDDQLREVHAFNYNNRTNDRYTGAFTGFGQQKEYIKYVDQSGKILGQEPVVIERNFNLDFDQENPLYFLSRHHMQGKTQSQITYDSQGERKIEDYFYWEKFLFNQGRVYPYLQQSVRKKQGIAQSLSQYFYEIDVANEVLNNVKSIADGITQITHHQYFPEKHLQRQKSALLYDHNESNPILKSEKVYSDETALLEQEKLVGENYEFAQTYFYDDLGRMIRFEKDNGLWEEYGYADHSPIKSRVKNSLGVSNQEISSLNSWPNSITSILGITFRYQYSADGFITRLQRDNDQTVLFSMPLSPLCDDEGCRNQNVFAYEEGGQSFELTLDGLGRVQETLTKRNSNEVSSGKSYFIGDNVWKMDPKVVVSNSENSSGDLSRNHFNPLIFDGKTHAPSADIDVGNSQNVITYPSLIKKNSLGEVTYIENSSGQKFSYQRSTDNAQGEFQECEKIVQHFRESHEIINEICHDNKGEKISEIFQGETLHFERDLLGRFISLPELGLKYEYDEMGNLAAGQGVLKRAESPSWGKIQIHYVPLENKVSFEPTGQTYEFDVHHRPLKFSSDEQHDQEIGEEFSYEGALLKKHHYLDSHQNELIREDFEYDRLGRINSFSVGPYRFVYTYSPYGEIVSKKIFKNEEMLIDQSFLYQDRVLKQIKPHLAHIKIHPLGMIEEIDYSVHAEMKFRYNFPQGHGLPQQISFYPVSLARDYDFELSELLLESERMRSGASPARYSLEEAREILARGERREIFERRKTFDNSLWSEEYLFDERNYLEKRTTRVDSGKQLDWFNDDFRYDLKSDQMVQANHQAELNAYKIPLKYWDPKCLNQKICKNLPTQLEKVREENRVRIEMSNYRPLIDELFSDRPGVHSGMRGIFPNYLIKSENNSENPYQKREWNKTTNDKNEVERDDEGRVKKIGHISLEYHHDLLLKYQGISFYYDFSGKLKIACPSSLEINELNLWSQCLVKIDEDHFIVKGHLVIREKVGPHLVGFWVDQNFYPAVSDHLGSVRAIFDLKGERVLVSRHFDAWGSGTTRVYSQNLDEREVVSLIPWSFAGLIDPVNVFLNKQFDSHEQLYWSQSRVYSPDLREWLSVDPMVKVNPQSLVGMPGNWKATEYASGDPVNLVDPTGHWGVKGEWVTSIDAGMGVQKAQGFALTYDPKFGLQFGLYKTTSELRFSAGAGISAGIGFSLTNSRNLEDVAGNGFGISYDSGFGVIGEIGGSYSKASDGFKVFDFGVGASLGASLRGSTGIYKTDITKTWYKSEISNSSANGKNSSINSDNYNMGLNYNFSTGK